MKATPAKKVDWRFVTADISHARVSRFFKQTDTVYQEVLSHCWREGKEIHPQNPSYPFRFSSKSK